MEEKRSIPGWAFMIAGIAIMGYTKFIQSRQPAAKIGIFFWVGIAFLVFGILREIAPRLAAKKAPKDLVGPPPQKEQQYTPTHLHPGGQHQHAVSPHTTHSHVMPQQHVSHPYQPMHKQCPRCHRLTHGQSRFCHMCGHQFY